MSAICVAGQNTNTYMYIYKESLSSLEEFTMYNSLGSLVTLVLKQCVGSVSAIAHLDI